MQLQFPYFPKDTKMISHCLGVHTQNDIVQYIANGLPVYSHSSDDLNAFRFITSNFIDKGLCSRAEVQRAFGVSIDSVRRSYRKYKDKGESGFFGPDARKGKAYKMVGKLVERIQAKLDKGQSNLSIAKQEGIAESSIRYHIGKGTLKKSPK